jgi:hypothetical protein
MTTFSNDTDLLKWEPVLFKELALATQTLCQGTDGALNGTAFTSAGGSFLSCGAEPGQVIALEHADHSLDGCFEIVSVDSETQLTLSVLRKSPDDPPVAPPPGTGFSYRVSSYGPQATEAAENLLTFFGIAPEADPDKIDVTEILNSAALRQASVFAILASVFAARAAGKDDSGFWEKAMHYQKLFHKARSRIRLNIDTDNDQIAEQIRSGGSVRLSRI